MKSFAGMGTVGVPLVIGQSLDHVPFGGAAGLPFDMEVMAERLEDFQIFFGHEDDVASKTMSHVRLPDLRENESVACTNTTLRSSSCCNGHPG